jgi:aspartate ammonia-lyase
MSTRIESDLLGSVAVPADALYGAQTQRALENFPVGAQRTTGSFPHLIRACVLIKQAAALTNHEIGTLDAARAQAIQQSAEALLARLPEYLPAFPVHYLHGGGGTSINMNVNEVLANLSEERLGGRRGEYRRVHPNDHVNLNQSTNDVYPTAGHMAVIFQWPGLRSALGALAEALGQVAQAYPGQVWLARTCYQDAVDIHFSDYLGGIASQVRRLTGRLETAVDQLHAVNLGGTICGRAEDAPAAYRERIVPNLAALAGDAGFHPAPDLFDAAQNPDALLAVSAALDILARSLIKIAGDFRVLSSGPEAGLGELLLPAVQPGSSIMPGKVNPSMPEFIMQIGFRVIGNHAMCAAGLDHGELDLNVWESSMTFAVLESLELLESGLRAFVEKCVAGLRPNPAVNGPHARTLIPRLARLARLHGYSRITALCKLAPNDPAALKALLDETFGGEV